MFLIKGLRQIFKVCSGLKNKNVLNNHLFSDKEEKNGERVAHSNQLISLYM